MAINPRITSWFATAVGRATDPDGVAGYQCVDTPKDYFEKVTGLSWREGWPGAGNAQDMLNTANTKYFDVIRNDPNNPNLIPQHADIIVWLGTPPGGINEYGHIGVVDQANAQQVLVVDQDGFSQRAMIREWLGYWNAGTGMCAGWLRFKPGILNAGGEVVNKNQRVVGKFGVTERKTPEVTASNATGRTFKPGDVLTFDGWRKGGRANGTDIWFRGAFSKAWFSASAFDDAGTHDLPNLTPAPAPTPPAPTLQPYQRVTGSAGVVLRAAADKNAAEVKRFGPGLTLDFKGFVRGTDPYGDKNSIWFVGRYSDAFVWSGGFTNKATTGLTDLTAQYTTPVTQPTKPYDFDLDFTNFVREDGVKIPVVKSPADMGNLQKGNPTAKYDNAVIHQFGTPGVDTLNSTNNQFKTKGVQVSAHYGVSGRNVYQFVSLADRAYHAGSVGNDYIGIETDPVQDSETIATVRGLLQALRVETGHQVIKPWRHKEIPGSSTNCGAAIAIVNYETPWKGSTTAPSDPDAPRHNADQENTAVRNFLGRIVDWLIKTFGAK